MMFTVRSATPYKFLNPNEDGEESAFNAPSEVQKTNKKDLAATSIKKSLQPVVKSSSQSKDSKKNISQPQFSSQKPSSTSKSRNIREKDNQQQQKQQDYKNDGQIQSSTSSASPPKSQRSDNYKNTGSQKSYSYSDGESISAQREQHRPPPHANKLKDRPHRTQGGGDYGVRRISHTRKDGPKKEIAGKSTWGHPIESQKEEVIPDDNEQPPQDNRSPRRPYRGDRHPQQRRLSQKGQQHPSQSNEDESSPKQEESANNQSYDTSQSYRQHQDRPSTHQKQPVDNKPLQLTLDEYIASKGASGNTEDTEPVKKSKGLYVASDDSEWAGITIPTMNEKVEAPKTNEKKKIAANKNKSQKILLTFDEKQPTSYSPEFHNPYRGPRARGGSKEYRGGGNYSRENYDSQKSQQSQKNITPRTPPENVESSSTTQTPEDQVQTNPPVESEVDFKKKFVIDFPALA